MRIDHPHAHPLSEEETLVLARFQKRLEIMVSNHGLTMSNVEEMVRELRAYPSISVQLMEEIRSEMGRLWPGQRFTFDWD